MRWAVRRFFVLLVLVCLTISVGAQDLLVGTYNQDDGTVQLVRNPEGEYYLKILGRTERPATLRCSAEEMTSLGLHIKDVVDGKEKAPEDGSIENLWGLEIGTQSVWLTLGTDAKHGPCLMLSSIPDEKGTTPTYAASRVSSARLAKLSSALLSIPSSALEMQRPNNVTVKGNYVPYQWKDGRAYITNQDAKTFLNFSGSTAMVDLLVAAEASGYLLEWRGNDVDLRRLSAAWVSPAVNSNSGVASSWFDYELPGSSSSSSGYSSSGSSYSSSGGSYRSSRARSGGGPVHVRSYTRKDGTVVRAHTRSRPTRRR